MRRAQSRAREKVLNVTQSAGAPVHFVFALAGAIKAAPDGDPLAGLKDSRRAFRLNLSEGGASRLLLLWRLLRFGVLSGFRLSGLGLIRLSADRFGFGAGLGFGGGQRLVDGSHGGFGLR